MKLGTKILAGLLLGAGGYYMLHHQSYALLSNTASQTSKHMPRTSDNQDTPHYLRHHLAQPSAMQASGLNNNVTHVGKSKDGK